MSKKFNDKDIDKVVELLKEAKQQKSEFVGLMDSFNDPYLVLIACILSLRTNDKTTYPATLRMLKLGKTPQDFAKCDEKEPNREIICRPCKQGGTAMKREEAFIINQNRHYWDTYADLWFGATALPTYGVCFATENE